MAKHTYGSHIPLFKNFTKDECKRVLAIAQNKVFAKDALIFHEGERGDSFYVISSGKVAIEKQPLIETTAPFLMLHLGRGDFFGEMALFGKGIRNSTARAINDTQMLVLPHQKLLSCLNVNPGLAAKFFKNMLQSIALRSFRVNQALMAFYEVGRLLSAPFDINTLLEQVLRIVMASLDASCGMILVKNIFLGGFEVKAVKGYMKERMQSLDIANCGFGAKALQEKEALLVGNMTSDPKFKSLPRLGYEKKSMLLVPFGTQQEKIGLLVLAGKRSAASKYTSDDLPLVCAIMQQIETVLENIQFQSEKEGRERLQRQYFTF